MNKGLVIGAVLLSVVALGVSIFQPKSVETVREVVKEQLGAQPSRDISENDSSLGGVRTWADSMPFASGAATTTACSFNSPNATTTLDFASAMITSATGTALNFEWGRPAFYTTSNTATNTRFASVNLAANVQGTITASTTPHGVFSDEADSAIIFPPNTDLNFKWGGSALGAQLAGSCKVIWIEN